MILPSPFFSPSSCSPSLYPVFNLDLHPLGHHTTARLLQYNKEQNFLGGMVRTTVQELAAAVEEPPRQYVVREQEDLLAADEMPDPIPLVDLSRLTTAADEADKLRAALETWGLFLVTNHGIEESLMDAMMSASREFFRQPSEEKQKCSNLIDDGKHFQVEGYGNDKVVNQNEGRSWNDRLHLRVEPEDERNYPKWPTRPESFRDVLHEYASKTKRIKDLILRSIAKILDLDEDYFINKTSNKASGFARFNYYPPCPRPDLVLGMRPHSDVGLLTILFVDHDVGGLQVERDGKWYNVPAKPYTLAINLGDCTEIMCNGMFRSPVHRVVTNAEKERLSLAVFYVVDGETVLEPAPGLLDDKRPPRYGKFKAKDFGLSDV